uniref:Uncharacterized protein n=1 Tax=Oryza barthii TaxID=65489 RepID=A0A0D3FDT1_9ORYZ
MMPFSVHDDDGGAAAQLGVVQIDGEEDDVVAASLRCVFQSAVGTTAFQRLPVAPEFEPGLGALLMGAGEVVLAGAVEEHAGAGLGSGAVEAETSPCKSLATPPIPLRASAPSNPSLPLALRPVRQPATIKIHPMATEEPTPRRYRRLKRATDVSTVVPIAVAPSTFNVKFRYLEPRSNSRFIRLQSPTPPPTDIHRIIAKGYKLPYLSRGSNYAIFREMCRRRGNAVLHALHQSSLRRLGRRRYASTGTHPHVNLRSVAPSDLVGTGRRPSAEDDAARTTASGYDYKKTKFIPAQFSKTMKTSQLQYKGRKNRRDAQRGDNPVKYFGLKLSAEINKRPGVTQFDCIILTLPPPQQNTSHPYIHHPRILKCSAQK